MKLYSIFFRDMKYCCWILPKFRSDKSFNKGLILIFTIVFKVNTSMKWRTQIKWGSIYVSTIMINLGIIVLCLCID